MALYEQPTGPDPTTEPSESAVDDATEGEARGPLLDEDNEKKVAKAVLKNWTAQDEGMSRTLAEIEQAEYWRCGERYVFIRPANNDKSYVVWRPMGVERLPATPDKVDELVRRVVAQMLVDPPKLEAVPSNNEEQAEQAAELATRIFEVEGGESGWNLRLVLEGAIDLSTTQKSAFAHVWDNPSGGGEQPVTVMAHPAVVQYDRANPQSATIDPATGQPTSELVTKYLQKDESLSPIETAETVRRWVPSSEVSLLGGRNVRFLPEWSRGISDADGVIVADYWTIGRLREVYPETMAAFGEPDLKKLVAWEPFDECKLLPEHARSPKEVGTRLDKEVTPDDAVALVLWEYHKQSPVYPKGAAICVAGGEYVLGKSTLEATVERPDGSEVPEVLEVPVAQNRCLTDWVGGHPLGVALVTKMGPWNELMGQQWTAVMDWLDRWNHPHQYLPLGSVVQPGQMASRGDEPIMVNPDGQPFTEQVPPMSPDMKEWYDRSIDGINNASNLQEAAQGMDSPSTESGISKQIVIEQAMANLSGMKQNAQDFLTRLGRILLQHIRAHTTVPRTVRYVGDDASYRVDEWCRADLYGTRDIRIARGSFTMMNPQYKQQRVMELANPAFPIISMATAQEMLTTSVTVNAGIADDPARLRVKRQLDAFFEKGAPFDPLPIDDFKEIAQRRLHELGKSMMSTRFQKLDPPRKEAFMAEFMRAKQMSGVLTAEDEAAQAQQMQQGEIQKEQMRQQGEFQKIKVQEESDMRLKQEEAKIEHMKVTAKASQEQAEGSAMGLPMKAPMAESPMPQQSMGEMEGGEMGEMGAESPAPPALTAPSNLTINVNIPPTSKTVKMQRNLDGGYDAVVEPMME